MLESKDKEQLLAIAQALGIKTTARAAKATLITKIIETTSPSGDHEPTGNGRNGAGRTASAGPTDAGTSAALVPANESDRAPGSDAATGADPATASDDDAAPAGGSATADASADGTDTARPSPASDEVLLGADGEPLADWEAELVRSGTTGDGDGDGDSATSGDASRNGSLANGDGKRDDARRTSTTTSTDEQTGDGDDGDDSQPDDIRPGESRNARRRRRRRNKGGGDGASGQGGDNRFEQRERQQRASEPVADTTEPISTEPVLVSGYLDLRDEGYGFLRINGYLGSKDDAYIPVKLTRTYGLRKGDHVTGLSRPAGRNEKNPAMLEIHTVNGGDPENAKNRQRFEDLTALFPDERLKLENGTDPANMTARIIDLVAPIGKGQRGIIVSPPKAGKTTVMKTIATAIEANNPEVTLMVLLIDERPEEVTDMRRTVRGEVISSTFDRPSDEHTHIAELVIEKAKRLVEAGQDVVIILDGITRLSRAYNLAAPASGRILSGGIDAGALYPPKKFFGAARNIEEGGSLTILATALVETNSRMDDAIFEEFKGTGNMELRLDRRLAERRIYPAIDVDASSTRHEELLFDRKQLQMVWKLRRVLSGLAADGNAAPGLELLIDRLRTFRTNEEFLSEIAKQPSM